MPTPTLIDILQLKELDALNNDEALSAVAVLVDHANDNGNLDLISRALTWCEALDVRALSNEQKVNLDYYRANAWAGRYAPKARDRAAAWAWEQPDLQQQIFLLRRALSNPAFQELPLIRKCEILTNLGNCLDTIGRFVDARFCWTEALRLEPEFWMARANRGRAAMHYANALYDDGHRGVFALFAHRDLTAALVSLGNHPEYGDPRLGSYFSEAARAIDRHFPLKGIEAAYQPDVPQITGSTSETAYRIWCCKEGLFLNPLNDFEAQSIAAHDVLMLPSFTLGIKEPPVIAGLFNQLKQEYASARWLYYEGITADSAHFSDRGVLLYDTLDHASYGLGVEKVRLAFRMAYSMWDKTAFFLNRYIQLNIPERKITFRSIWRAKEKMPVRPEFDLSENWAFRGLYWLSKDVFEEGFKESTEPDARAVHELRNHLEHKYVKVHEMELSAGAGLEQAAFDPFADTLAYAITKNDLHRKTLRLLKLVRATLIYLSLGVHREERRRNSFNDLKEPLLATTAIHTFADDRKV